jgi:hypothetical protein
MEEPDRYQPEWIGDEEISERSYEENKSSRDQQPLPAEMIGQHTYRKGEKNPGQGRKGSDESDN